MIKLAPSILSADFSKLGCELKRLEQAGADWIHIDVMDGHFVPNLTFGAPVVEKIRSCTNLFFDCHLMIENPSLYVEDFAKAGADLITVHVEAEKHLHRLIEKIKSLKSLQGQQMQVGISLNPATSLGTIEEVVADVDLVLLMSVNPGFGNQKFIPATLEKLSRLKSMLAEKQSKAVIQVDGGVNQETAPSVRAAGADVLVAGSAVFSASDLKAIIKKLRGED